MHGAGVQPLKVRNLADESAVLVAGMYVDLNPIRAGETMTPEQSQYTSGYDRIRGHKQRAAGGRSASSTSDSSWPDRWLCELTLQEGPQADERDGLSSRAPWRASDKGLLSISIEEYLKLLDWTGRQVRQDKRGAIPADLAPILERLHINQENWLKTISQFHTQFGEVVGRVEQLAQAAAQMGVKWLKGVTAAAESFE